MIFIKFADLIFKFTVELKFKKISKKFLYLMLLRLFSILSLISKDFEVKFIFLLFFLIEYHLKNFLYYNNLLNKLKSLILKFLSKFNIFKVKIVFFIK